MERKTTERGRTTTEKERKTDRKDKMSVEKQILTSKEQVEDEEKEMLIDRKSKSTSMVKMRRGDEGVDEGEFQSATTPLVSFQSPVTP